MPSATRPAPHRKLLGIASAATLAAMLLGGPLSNSAQAAVTVVPLGTTSAFSVLAGSTVTNTGATTVDRSVGVHPGTAITGDSTMTVGGTYHAADDVALQAKNDLITAYTNAAGQTPRIAADPDFDGQSLVGGVYNRDAAMALTGVLTLNGQNNASSVWVFQAGTSLTVANASSIVLINGANPCNVFWQVGSSATLGTTSSFVGTIMADQTITMNTGATLQGRVLARSAAVNLHNNTITSPDCTNDVDVPDGTDDGDVPDGTTTPPDTGGEGGAAGTGGSGNGGVTSGTNGGTGNATETQVTATPAGAVDTGYAGPAHRSEGTPGALVSTLVFGAVGGLAFVAVRRRRRV